MRLTELLSIREPHIDWDTNTVIIWGKLHRRGLDVEHIMRLGGWESLDMVLRYTRRV